MKNIGGWLLVYLTGSVPVTLFFAIGLAARFFNYHWAAVLGAFAVLAAPLVLVVLKSRFAPTWNIVSLWLGAGSLSLILFGAVFTAEPARLWEAAPMMMLIASGSIAWASLWTMYFLRSDRVSSTLVS